MVEATSRTLDEFSHEVILEVARPILVAALSNGFFVIHEVVRMVSFIGLLPPLLLNALLLLLARLLSCSVTIPQLLLTVLALLPKVWGLLHFGLV
jgi:hypothetical protein